MIFLELHETFNSRVWKRTSPTTAREQVDMKT
jgi:hypothetical protein